MTVPTSVLVQDFDLAKQNVRDEILNAMSGAEDFFSAESDELYKWLSDRAVDEYKIAYQLNYIILNFGHKIPARFCKKLAQQVTDEYGHYLKIYEILPSKNRADAEELLDKLVEVMNADLNWIEKKTLIDSGNFYDALLEINLAHEGFSAAAIEALCDCPVPAIAVVFQEIAKDENRHAAEGVDLYDWLLANAPSMAGRFADKADLVGRSYGGAMKWTWTPG